MNFKEFSFWVIGIMTLIYCVIELGVGLAQHSLALLSDGFHNLSDVISLYIAFWSSRASRRGRSDTMSYGWKRTEILGALTNGIFLVSLAVYITLETIPELVVPEPPPTGLLVVIIAALGLIINTGATVVFYLTGQAHGHSHAAGGHGHSHGGHGHAHGGDIQGESEDVLLLDEIDEHDEHHGHSHKKKKDHGHSHDGDHHGHSHAHGGHSDHEEHDHEEHHGHSHEKKKDHGHAHDEDHHGHSHKQKIKTTVDVNTRAVCLHYMGDMLSSFIVLCMGIVLTVFSDTDPWTYYIDPLTSLIIVVLIFVTTLPLLKGCFLILLQRTPPHINIPNLRNSIAKMSGVLNVHDFHVWQLVDGMIITSLHIMVEEGRDFSDLAKKIKKLLHKSGIHSSCIQPEFARIDRADSESCLEHCVKDCKADWCCKEPQSIKQRPPSSLLQDTVSMTNYSAI